MPGVSIVRGRIPCPLHNGCDRNMSLQDKFFHCFVCNESGDVIKLVMHLLNCSYEDAISRINNDFRLGLPLDATSLYKLHTLDKKYHDFMRRREQEKAEEDDFEFADDTTNKDVDEVVEKLVETILKLRAMSPIKSYDDIDYDAMFDVFI